MIADIIPVNVLSLNFMFLDFSKEHAVIWRGIRLAAPAPQPYLGLTLATASLASVGLILSPSCQQPGDNQGSH